MVSILITSLWYLSKKGAVFYPLSYGINGELLNSKGTIHAEKAAILNLPLNTNKIKKVDLIVLRISHCGTIGNSKCCFKCVHHLDTLPLRYGYRINNIYYSNCDRKITATSLKNLLEDPKPHVSIYYRKNKARIYHGESEHKCMKIKRTFDLW